MTASVQASRAMAILGDTSTTYPPINMLGVGAALLCTAWLVHRFVPHEPRDRSSFEWRKDPRVLVPILAVLGTLFAADGALRLLGITS